MPATSYAICTLASGVSALADIKGILTATAADPFPAPFQSFSEIVGTDLNGAPIKAGLPRCTWHWDFMFRSDYDALAAFAGNCYLKTKKTDGTLTTYSAIMAITKEPPPITGGRVGPVDVEFTMLVAQ